MDAPLLDASVEGPSSPAMAGFTVPAEHPIKGSSNSLIETGLVATLLRIRLPKLDSTVQKKTIRMVVVGMLGLVSSIMQNELLWYTNTCRFEQSETCIPDPVPMSSGNCSRVIQLRPTNVSSGMKWLTFVLTLLLIVLILDYYRFQLKVERQRLRAPDLQLWHIKKFSVALAVEVFVCALHPLPFLKSLDESVEASNPYGFFGESRWTTAMFLRLYLVFRLLRDRYPLYKKRGRLEADLLARGLPPPRFDWFLSFKATFHTSGPKWLASILIILVSTLAYCHSLAEREYQPELFHSGPGFVLYYTILLMTAGGPSVGTPCSGWGQAIGIVTCLSGVVILALTVTVVETKLALSAKATTALKWDDFDICSQRERDAAAKYIQKLWKLNHELADRPALRASRKFLRRRAITRSVVSVTLSEARRRRVLAERELGWLPMDTLGEQLASSEVDQIAAAQDAQTAAAQQPLVRAGASAGAVGTAVPPELMTTLNQILSAQAELARVQESLVQAVRHSGQATAALVSAQQRGSSVTGSRSGAGSGSTPSGGSEGGGTARSSSRLSGSR